MQITKNHYIDVKDLEKLDIEVYRVVADIFIFLSDGRSKITEGTERLSVQQVLDLKIDYEKMKLKKFYGGK